MPHSGLSVVGTTNHWLDRVIPELVGTVLVLQHGPSKQYGPSKETTWTFQKIHVYNIDPQKKRWVFQNQGRSAVDSVGLANWIALTPKEELGVLKPGAGGGQTRQ